MSDRTDYVPGVARQPWFRLGCSVGLALILAAIMVFIPITAKTGLPISSSSQDKVIDLSLPFAAEMVHATGGLTITKTSVPTAAARGELITYTLIMTNMTSFDLVNIIITDVVPANTDCISVIPPPGPGKWFGTTPCPGEEQVEWVNIYNTNPSLPPIWRETIPDGATVFFTFTVGLTDAIPLQDRSTITNAIYGVTFSAKESMSNTQAFTDVGPSYTVLVNAPKWEITKSTSPTVEPGQRLTYTVIAQNIGHFETDGSYTITEVIPQYTTYITSTPEATETGGQLTWKFTDTLDVNDTRVVTFVVQVRDILTDGLSIVNLDYAVTGGFVFTGAVGTPFSTTVRSTPNLTITKTADPEPQVEAGALLTYTLTVTNQSPAQGPALDVLISDTIPANTVFRNASFVSPATGTFTRTGNLVEWSLTNPITLDEKAEVQLLLQVRSPLPSGTLLVNTHSVSASNAPAIVQGNPVTSVVSSSSQIDGISKVVQPPSVLVGGLVTYTITITNAGNEEAAGVAVTDTLGVAFPTSSFTFTNISIPGRDITGTGGITTVVFTATAPSVSGIYSNTAITVTNGTEVDTLGESAPLIVTSPALSLTKVSASSAVTAGDTLAYTLIYTNNSGTVGTNVRITDTLPAGVTLVDSQPPTDTQVGDDVSWLIGSIGGNITGTVALTISIPADFSNNTVITNSAIITSTEGSGDSTGPVTVTVRAPVLNLDKSDFSDPVQAGGVLTYTLTYSNSGGAAASPRISDTFDSNTSFVSANPAPTGGTGQIRFWDIANLPPDSIDRTIVITVNVTSPLTNNTILTNTASITTLVLTDQATETTQVASSEQLNISKVGSNGSNPVRPSSLITYTISYSNSGNAIARNVRISDTIDSNTTFVGATTGFVNNDPNFIWDVGDLVPSNTFQITMTVQVTDSLPDNTVLTNTVIISSDTGAQATAEATATVQSRPILHLTKRASNSIVEAGGTLTYTIYYSNTGDAPASGVVITDTLPPELHLQNANPMTDSGSDPTYRWDIGPLPVGGPSSITLVVTADTIITDLLQLTNAVTMTSVETTTLGATEVVTAHSVELNVTKSGQPDPVKANEFITYSVTVQNLGHATADNVTITDTLPISLVQSSVTSSTSPGVTFDSFTPPVTYLWTAPTLAGQSSLTLSIRGRLATDPWPAAGLPFSNTIEVRSDDGDVDSSNNITQATATGRPNDPFTLTLTANPTTTMIGNTIGLTATVTDQWGNPAFNGQQVDFQTSLGDFSSTSATTQNGLATTSISATIPGVALVTGTTSTGGITGTTTVTFTAGPPDRFIIAPIGDQVAGVPFSITITVVDVFTNPILTYNNSAALNDTTGTLNPTATGANWVNGVYSATAVITQAITNDAITATQGAISGTSNLFDVLAGPPATAVMTVTTPVSMCGTSLISATVFDAHQNRVQASEPISFYSMAGGPSVLLLSNPRQTDNNGFVTTTLTAVGGSAGSVQVGVDVNNDYVFPDTSDWEDEDTVNFTDPPALTNLTLNIAPNPLFTGGNTGVITATVTDCTGSPAGHQVSFTVSDPSLASVTPDPFVATTDAGGVATATITSSPTPVTGTVTITATVGNQQVTTTLDVQPPPTPVLSITKTSDPAAGTARPGWTIDYTIRVDNTGTGTATNVIITDTLPISVNFVSGDSSSGIFGFDNGSRTFTATTAALGIDESLTATIEVTVTATVSGTVLDNLAQANSLDTPLISSTIVSHQVVTGTIQVYLPIVMKDFESRCVDLEVTDLSVISGNVIQVVVRNSGTCATDSNFWVDLYADPDTLPGDLVGVTADRAWNSPAVSATHGMAWEVPILGASTSITLTTDGSVGPQPEDMEWPPGAGASIYAYADSFDNNDVDNATVVEIRETDETNNQFGPILFPTGLGSGTTGELGSSPSGPRRDLD